MGILSALPRIFSLSDDEDLVALFTVVTVKEWWANLSMRSCVQPLWTFLALSATKRLLPRFLFQAALAWLFCGLGSSSCAPPQGQLHGSKGSGGQQGQAGGAWRPGWWRASSLLPLCPLAEVRLFYASCLSLIICKMRLVIWTSFGKRFEIYWASKYLSG